MYKFIFYLISFDIDKNYDIGINMVIIIGML